MGDRLERTDVWQQYHDRVTAEVPVVVVSDSQRLDMFHPGPQCDPMHDDDPTPTARSRPMDLYDRLMADVNRPVWGDDE